ncbi:hypothetical protein EC968_003261 [Mortierella alpina]|nr:hypothetical protein EC968_003261 [Mortierella alpina]
MAQWAATTMPTNKDDFSSFEEAVGTACVLLLQSAVRGQAELTDKDRLLIRYHAKKVESVKYRYTRQDLSIGPAVCPTRRIRSTVLYLTIKIRLMYDIPSESMRVDWWDDHEPVILSSCAWIDKKLRGVEDVSSSEEIRNQLLRKYRIQSTVERNSLQVICEEQGGRWQAVSMKVVAWDVVSLLAKDKHTLTGPMTIATMSGMKANHIEGFMPRRVAEFFYGIMTDMCHLTQEWRKEFKDASEESDMGLESDRKILPIGLGQDVL